MRNPKRAGSPACARGSRMAGCSGFGAVGISSSTDALSLKSLGEYSLGRLRFLSARPGEEPNSDAAEHFMRPLQKVFWDEMAEMLHIQEMLLKALPRMSAAAEGDSFKEALEAYRLDIQQQSEKLRTIFRFFEMFAREKKSDGMMGLLTKGQQLIQRTGRGPTLDAALLSVCRKITGYTQAAYCSLHSWAKLIMKTEPATVTSLKELLRNEMQADVRFSRLVAECDPEAANQTVESVRRPGAPPRRVTKEIPDLARWGEW